MARAKSISKLVRTVREHFQNDDFIQSVLTGCVRVRSDSKNPIRGNFLASGCREIIGHVLHKLAPDDEVRNCEWFVQAKDTDITRNQRAKYMVQAGLTDKFVLETLNIDVDQSIKPLLKSMHALHKATHVRPDTVLSDLSEIDSMFGDVLSGLDKLMKAAKNSRHEVTEAVVNVMQDAVFDNLLSDTIQNIDELSTHSRIDGHYIDDIDVILTASDISYFITGQVEVELQYGSDSDVRNDIGFQTGDSYPYTASVSCKAIKPMDVKSEDIDLQVDTSSFYE